MTEEGEGGLQTGGRNYYPAHVFPAIGFRLLHYWVAGNSAKTNTLWINQIRSSSNIVWKINERPSGTTFSGPHPPVPPAARQSLSGCVLVECAIIRRRVWQCGDAEVPR